MNYFRVTDKTGKIRFESLFVGEAEKHVRAIYQETKEICLIEEVTR